MKAYLFYFFLFVFPILAFAQDKVSFFSVGYPIIDTFLSSDYNLYVQNFAFEQDERNFIYIANQGTVVEYDGSNFNFINIPNHRATALARNKENNIIYVGGDGEFGYLSPSETDTIFTKQYVSLKHLLPENVTDIGMIWQIVTYKNTVLFRSRNYLLNYTNGELKVIEPETSFQSIAAVNGYLFVKQAKKQIQFLEGDNLVDVTDEAILPKGSINVYLPNGRNVLLGYKNGEYFIFDGKSFHEFGIEEKNYLINSSAYTAERLDDGSIVIGTLKGGLVIYDAEGWLKYKITKEQGLLSNTVYSIYKDNSGDIWVGHDNGFSILKFSIPLRIIDKRNGIDHIPTVLSKAKNGYLLGTSNGGFYLKFDDRKLLIQNIAELSGMCSDARQLADKFAMVCSNSVQLLSENDEHLKINDDVRARAIYPLKKEENLYLISDINSLGIFKLENDSFRELKRIEEVKVFSTSFLQDTNGTIWLGTTSNGVYRLNVNDINTLSYSIHNYPVIDNSANKSIRVAELEHNPVFLTSKGLYSFSEKDSSFTRGSVLSAFIDDSTVQFHKLETGFDGDLWIRANQKYEYLKKGENGYFVPYSPLNMVSINQPNQIFLVSDHETLFLTEHGIYSYDYKMPFREKEFGAYIRQVLVRNDSLINGGEPATHILDYNDNELRFTYAASAFQSPQNTQYRILLSGFNEEWSKWTQEGQKDYTNIPEGDYIFKVQAKDVYGTLSTIDTFNFTIRPPWYRTWWAYLIYIVTISIILYVFYKIRVNQLLKVERMRNRIATDLHDEVSATLSSISFFAQAINSENIKGDKRKFVNLIEDSAGDAKEKITDIVWAINPEHDDWGDFLSKCRRYASDLLESKGLRYNLQIDEISYGKMKMEYRQHLWMIFKEMITNSVRHANATRVDVVMNRSNNVFKLIVQDDGQGFDSSSKLVGNGVANIKKRAAKIKASVTLESETGFGTRWILEFPVH